MELTAARIAALSENRLALHLQVATLSERIVVARTKIAAALVRSNRAIIDSGQSVRKESAARVPIRSSSKELMSDFDQSDDEYGDSEEPRRLSVNLSVLAADNINASETERLAPKKIADRVQRKRSFAVEASSRSKQNDKSSRAGPAPGDLVRPRHNPKLGWAKLRVTTSLLLAFHRSRYPWRQLAGHQDNFKKGDNPSWILKKGATIEEQALTKAMEDPVMRKCVVEFKGPTIQEGTRYLMLKNLLLGHVDPSILDLKMGQRTYLTKDKSIDEPRKDLLKKLLKIDASVATQEELKVGVTKRRYMQFRERRSTSASHGFRVESCHISSSSESEKFCKYDKDGHGYEQTIALFSQVCRHRTECRNKIVFELEQLYSRLTRSEFFKSHEVVGSSILVVVGKLNTVSANMLDFGKTVPADTALSHDVSVDEVDQRSQEDGYLIGLKNLIEMFRVCLGDDFQTSPDTAVPNQDSVDGIPIESLRRQSSFVKTMDEDFVGSHLPKRSITQT